MKRYEFKGTITVIAETKEEAETEIEDALHFINKSPDGPRIFLDDVPPEIDEDLGE